jgi:hypothetical protein
MFSFCRLLTIPYTDLHKPFVDQYPVFLTPELLSKTDVAPPGVKTTRLDCNVSDTGVEDLTSTADLNPEADAIPDSRNNIAPEAIGLQDWDGTWAPAPASWENERNGFSNDFIPTYINIWNRANGDFPNPDLTNPTYISGERVVNTWNGALVTPNEYPLCFPSKLHPFKLRK